MKELIKVCRIKNKRKKWGIKISGKFKTTNLIQKNENVRMNFFGGHRAQKLTNKTRLHARESESGKLLTMDNIFGANFLEASIENQGQRYGSCWIST